MAKKPLTTKADETPEFVEFWEGPLLPDGTRDRRKGWRSIARHTDGRGDARDAFLKHIEAGADGQDIADGGKWFIHNLKDGDRQYVPLVATWINRRAYEDGAEMWRDMQEKLQEASIRRSDNVTRIQQPPRRKTAFLEAYEREQAKKQAAQ
ncbi:hypothetical protein [Oricola thermophila]|uniref:Uncharacterized protein n=1 Tax=Oricola thermophila TaxID=2742145 RepID=A0A6N1VFB2_9HYPH|nr:hypothetical protein [Oricola thermophila]QKV17839.1 hypothetical protein HTY61_04885 [Oricola thermophila]